MSVALNRFQMVSRRWPRPTSLPSWCAPFGEAVREGHGAAVAPGPGISSEVEICASTEVNCRNDRERTASCSSSSRDRNRILSSMPCTSRSDSVESVGRGSTPRFLPTSVPVYENSERRVEPVKDSLVGPTSARRYEMGWHPQPFCCRRCRCPLRLTAEPGQLCVIARDPAALLPPADVGAFACSEFSTRSCDCVV